MVFPLSQKAPGVGLVAMFRQTMPSRQIALLADQLGEAVRQHKLAQPEERRRLGPL
jgi:hypothetical protein